MFAAVAAGVGAADGARVDLLPGQVRHVLPPSCRPDPPMGRLVVLVLIIGVVVGRGDPATKSLGGNSLLDLDDRLIQVGDLVPLGGPHRLVAGELEVRPQSYQRLLSFGGRLRTGVGFVAAVPAFADLDLPQPLRALGARHALVLAGRPTRQVDQLRLTGAQIGAAQRDRPGAHAVLDREVLQHVDAARQGQAGGPGTRPRLGEARRGRVRREGRYAHSAASRAMTCSEIPTTSMTTRQFAHRRSSRSRRAQAIDTAPGPGSVIGLRQGPDSTTSTTWRAVRQACPSGKFGQAWMWRCST